MQDEHGRMGTVDQKKEEGIWVLDVLAYVRQRERKKDGEGGGQLTGLSS